MSLYSISAQLNAIFLFRVLANFCATPKSFPKMGTKLAQKDSILEREREKNINIEKRH
jgi:hypothetical protein